MKLLIAALAAAGLGLAPLPSSAQGAAPTDPQIAAIVVAANQVDIDAGKYAESHSSNKDVKAFAHRMVVDHTGVNKQASALVTKLKVKPEPNPTSESLIKGGQENMAKLKNMKGAAFDKAYIDHEVTYHEAVLDALDKTLIPNAQNAELEALIVKVRPVIAEHLAHAKHLQGTLGA